MALIRLCGCAYWSALLVFAKACIKFFMTGLILRLPSTVVVDGTPSVDVPIGFDTLDIDEVVIVGIFTMAFAVDLFGEPWYVESIGEEVDLESVFAFKSAVTSIDWSADIDDFGVSCAVGLSGADEVEEFV